jgi:thiol:disulfide interchange protein
MKKALSGIFIILLNFLFPLTGLSQEKFPVSVTVESKKVSDTEYDIIFSTTIDEGWHQYSLKEVPDGPRPTYIEFKKSADYELVGPVTESKPHEAFDKVFEVNVFYFEKSASFRQRIKVKTEKTFKVAGTFECQACTEEKCVFMNPPHKFSVEIKGNPAAAAAMSSAGPAFGSATGTATPTTAAPASSGEWKVPVTLRVESRKISETEYELVFKTTIDKGWHQYSLKRAAAKDGPWPTEIRIAPSPDYELVGGPVESAPKEGFDKVFEMDLRYFEDSATFTQRIRLKAGKTVRVTGTFGAQFCNDSQCSQFQPPKDFSVELAGSAAAAGEGDLSCDTPWWLILIKGIGFGLAALITPCVFPMIPMNVSFFLKRNKKRSAAIREAMLFMLSIVVIYTALGLLITAVFGVTALNAIASSATFNLVFFVILVIFGISFLGAFEIVLPSSWINKMDSQGDKGGFLGIFFMATTLSLVSFSCTSIFIGNLLTVVTDCPSGPLFGFLGFGFGFALPFGIFAIVPSWLQSMPKSGGWLNTVKVTLGLLELALALKFASNADLVYQAHILTREVFLTLWIILFGVTGIYLMGWIKLSHDSPMAYLTIPRLFFAIFSFAFAVYMVPGLWGAPLNLLSGVIPPSTYAEWKPQSGTVVQSGQAAAGSLASKMVDGPQGLKVFHNDYESALAYAKEVKKPLLLDFTGHACANCRKMEDNVWPDPEVKSIMASDLVIVSLFVDDREKLPETEQKEVDWRGDKVLLETQGMRWGYMQDTRYKISSQPYYVIIDHDESLLSNSGIGYDTGKDLPVFKAWLSSAIARFRQNHP